MESTNSRVAQRKYILAFLALVLAALALKFLYLHTAESAYNAEELPLAAMGLVGGAEALTNVASTRLYGTSYITTAIALKLFGFSVFALKAPNIAFFFLTLGFLWWTARRYLVRLNQWYVFLPSALLCLGPPVIQMWSMKNRGGFIENIFALTVCLGICAYSTDGRLSAQRKLLLGVVVGLAVWSQPIGIIWGSVLFAYVVLAHLHHSLKEAAKATTMLGGGFLLGVLPLVALNFLFRFNTARIIEGGEMPGGVDLGYGGRLQQMLVDGVPRLLGLKEQWNPDWILPSFAAWPLYVVFVLPALIASVGAISHAIRTRRFTFDMVIVLVGVAVIAANVISSWGNFQSEPRRLLLLYIPFALLTARGLARSPKAAVLYFCVWVAFSSWANYAYVSKHPDGFSHRLYRPLGQLAGLLEKEEIQGVYSDVWTGSRVTFASEGHIPWFRSGYVPTSYGFIGDELLSSDEAMLFNPVVPNGSSGRKRFLDDVQRAGINCVERKIMGVSVIYDCSREFEFSDLSLVRQPRTGVVGEIAMEFDASDNRVVVSAGIRSNGTIVSNGAGYLVYGPYVPLTGGKYTVQLQGTSRGPFTLDVASALGRKVHARTTHGGWLSERGNLIELDFELEHPVDDLEIRVSLPASTAMELVSYRVIHR